MGKGVVDWAALASALEASGYDGSANVEQDIDPAISLSPLEDAKASRSYLRSVGSESPDPRFQNRRGGCSMPRINVRYDASVVRASELASLMPALADIGAERYDTTPDKVVVELFAQSGSA